MTDKQKSFFLLIFWSISKTIKIFIPILSLNPETKICSRKNWIFINSNDANFNMVIFLPLADSRNFESHQDVWIVNENMEISLHVWVLEQKNVTSYLSKYKSLLQNYVWPLFTWKSLISARFGRILYQAHVLILSPTQKSKRQ